MTEETGSNWQEFSRELAQAARDVRVQLQKDSTRVWTLPELIAATEESSSTCKGLIVQSIWLLQGDGEVTYDGDLNLVSATSL